MNIFSMPEEQIKMSEEDTYDSNWQFSRYHNQLVDEVPSNDVIQGRLNILALIICLTRSFI